MDTVHPDVESIPKKTPKSENKTESSAEAPAQRSARELFNEIPNIISMKEENKRIAVAQLLKELYIDPAKFANSRHALREIQIVILKRMIKEKGIQTGARVTVSGKQGTYVVRSINESGRIYLAGLEGAFSPNSVDLVAS